MEMPEGAKLFAQAARRLRASFDSIHSGIPHAGERGRETQNALIAFLNKHLPKRFHTASGFILDSSNTMSGHEDVIVYDQQNAYVFSPAEDSLIVPNDNVAAVIEVKSTLSKAELGDAAEKIAKIKRLTKVPELPTDFAQPHSRLQLTLTRGIVFAYSSLTSLESLWANLRELNTSIDSDLWVDEVVVLDQGSIAYSTQLPVSSAQGHYGGKTSRGAIIFPIYVVPMLYNSPEATLPSFMARLSAHLSHYRLRPAPALDSLLPADESAKSVGGYWFDTLGKLVQVPGSQIRSDGIPPPKPRQRIIFHGSADEVVGQIEWLNWADGHVLAFRVGRLPAPEFVINTALMAYQKPVHTIEVAPGLMVTSLLPGRQPPDFRRVCSILSSPATSLRAELIDFGSAE